MATADHSTATMAAPLVTGEVKVRGMACQERIIWFLTKLWQVNTTLGLGPCVKAKAPHSHFYPSKWTVALLAAPQIPGSKENMLCWTSGVVATSLGAQ